MKSLWEEAGTLGDQTNELHGDRNIGYPRIATPNLTQPQRQRSMRLKQAQAAKADEKKDLIQSVIDITNSKTITRRRAS